MGGPTPELEVSNLGRSLAFYVGVIGFAVMFDRPEERFAFLTLEGVHLMLEEAAGPGRRFRTAPLEHPYGRGVNFMIEVAEIDRCTAEFRLRDLRLSFRWKSDGIGKTRLSTVVSNSLSPTQMVTSYDFQPRSAKDPLSNKFAHLEPPCPSSDNLRQI